MTGASGNLGRLVGSALRARGYRLACWGRSAPPGLTSCDLLQRCDFGAPVTSCAWGSAQALEAFVLMAGIDSRCDLELADRSSVDEVLWTNALSQLGLLNELCAAGALLPGARIVALSTDLVERVEHASFVYVASKLILERGMAQLEQAWSSMALEVHVLRPAFTGLPMRGAPSVGTPSINAVGRETVRRILAIIDPTAAELPGLTGARPSPRATG